MRIIRRILFLALSLCIFLGCFACGKEEEKTNEKTFPNVKFWFDYAIPEEKEDGYKMATVSVDNCAEENAFSDIDAEIKIRGNSTAQADKKPYRIKFFEKRSMLGLNDGAECRNWVLLADAYDYSMSRNYFMFGLGKVFDNIYCTDRAYVNLYINDEYKGVYLLVEQQQANKNRVNIDEKNIETSADTGYFLEIDSRADGEGELFDESVTVPMIRTDKDYYFEVTHKTAKNSNKTVTKKIAVKSDLASNKIVRHAQLTKISQYIQRCYDAMFNYEEEYNIRSLIDIPSAVDMFLLNTFATTKVGNLSEFMYVDFTDAEPRLHFGAPWDFDLDLNNYADDNYNTEEITALNNTRNLFYPLSTCDWFKAQAKARWFETDAEKKIEDMINDLNPYRESSTCNLYKKEFTRNYDLWEVFGKEPDNPYSSTRSENFSSHTDAMKDLHAWVRNRYDYVCAYMNQL